MTGAADSARGGAAVELALLAPLLVTLLLGSLEFGLLWRSSDTVAQTTRAAVIDLSRDATSRDSDRLVLDRVRAAVGSGLDDIAWVIVYRPEPGSGAVPAACASAAMTLISGSVGVAQQCNVYSGDFIASLSPDDFDDPDCDGDADRWFCPTDRRFDAESGLSIGVEIRVDHSSVTPFLPGGGRSVSDQGVALVLDSTGDR